jgi:tetratricopeptide (TPR) repeat protein
VLAGYSDAVQHDPTVNTILSRVTKLSVQHSIGILAQYSMVTTGTESKQHAIHPVVHAWCLHNLGESTTKREMLAAALRCVSKMAKSTRGSVTREKGFRLATHARAIAGSVTTHLDDGDEPYACARIAFFLYDWEKSKEVETLYLWALHGYEKVRGAHHADTLLVANNLGNLYLSQGKIAKAEELYLRALHGYEKVWGPDHMGHVDTLDTVNNLANLYAIQGKLADAEQTYLRVLRGKEQALGADHASTLNTVDNLGILYQRQGKRADAKEMHLRVLREKEKSLGSDHLSTLDTVNNLALLYKDQNKMAEAEEMFLRVLHGKEKVWGPDHPSTLDTVNNLGLLYKDQGKTSEAEKTYLRALHGKQKVCGPEHISTLDTIYNLGMLYSLDLGKTIQAEEMYLRALHGYEKTLGPAHSSTLYTVNEVGILYFGQGKIAEAEEMWQRTIRTVPHTFSEQRRVADVPLLRLLSLYRQRACECVSIRSGRHLRLLSALIFPDGGPRTIWSKVLGLRYCLEKWPERHLYSLGRILLGIGDELNAACAFQHYRAIAGNYLGCDGCDRAILANENQYACKSCDEKDFCYDCWLRCCSDDVQDHPTAIAQCTGHSFCKVPAIGRIELQKQEAALQAAKEWITKLFESGPTFED